MRISDGVLAMMVVSVLAVNSQGQIVTEMTPERIREAIEVGTKAKEVWPYRIQEKTHISLRPSFPPQIAVFTTPFLRVALAASTAGKRHQAFTQKDVTPEMVAPEIHVYARSQTLDSATVADVVSIVVLPHKTEDTNQAVRPSQMSAATEEYKALYGFDAHERAMLAVFPADVWRESNEVHVVFDREIPSARGPSARGGCIDCKSQIYMDKVREHSVARGGQVGDAPDFPLVAEVGGVYSWLRPDRNAGKFENQGAAWGFNVWVGCRYQPNWVIEGSLILLRRRYYTPAALLLDGGGAHVDRLMVLETRGIEGGLRAMTTMRPFELFAGGGAGLYRSKLVVYGSIFGFPGEYRSSEKWGPGLRLRLGGDLIIHRNARLGFECNYFYLTGDFGELSPGRVNIGGFQALLRLTFLSQLVPAVGRPN